MSHKNDPDYHDTRAKILLEAAHRPESSRQLVYLRDHLGYKLVSLEEQAGIYLSDVAGHLLSLKIDPVRVACISCSETCNMSDFRGKREAEPAAKAFMAKHGALDRKIAENIDEIVQYYLDNKITRWTDDQGHTYVQDPKGNTVCYTDVFDLPKE
jgi:hypothetical protein